MVLVNSYIFRLLQLYYRAICISAAFRVITNMIHTVSTFPTVSSISTSLDANTLSPIFKVTILIPIAVFVKLAVWGTFKTIDTFLPHFTLTCNILVGAVDQVRVVADRPIRILNRDIKVQTSTNHWSAFKQANLQIRIANPEPATIYKANGINFSISYT